MTGLYEAYLSDPTQSPFDVLEADYSGLTRQLLGQRISQLLNTYWLTSIAPLSVSGELTTDDIASVSVLNGTWIKSHDERYLHVYQGWLMALILASSVLAILCVISATLRIFGHSPDSLAILSALTRGNCIHVPPGGPYLDGDERVRRLGQQKLMLGDRCWAYRRGEHG